MKKRRIIIIPPRNRVLGEKLLPELRDCIFDLVLAMEFHDEYTYMKALVKLSQILPYDIVRKFDEKLGISLAWELYREVERRRIFELPRDVVFHFPEFRELRSRLLSKLHDLKPEVIKEILDEFSSYFNLNIDAAFIKRIIQDYLANRMSLSEFLYMLRVLLP